MYKLQFFLEKWVKEKISLSEFSQLATIFPAGVSGEPGADYRCVAVDSQEKLRPPWLWALAIQSTIQNIVINFYCFVKYSSFKILIFSA